MFIQTESTPNPLTLKFIPGQPVLEKGTLQIRNAEDAAQSPLAQRIFMLDGVAGVFLAHDFISITKTEAADWQILKTFALAAIMDHYLSGQPVLQIASNEMVNPVLAEKHKDNSIVKEIMELLETRVRPAVRNDGGDIIFHDFEQGIVYLEMHGACVGCPSSTITLKNGIENMLKHYIPEVESVQAVY